MACHVIRRPGAHGTTAVLAGVLAALAACSTDGTPRRVQFVDLGFFPFESPSSEAAFSVPHRPELPGVALRLTAVSPSGATLCFQVAEVSAASGEVLSTTSASDGLHCLACAHRVFFGAGSGLFIFPNNGADVVLGEALRVRVAASDCETLTRPPGSPVESGAGIRVEAMDLPEPGPSSRGRLHLRLWIDPGNPSAEGDPLRHPMIQAATERIEALFKPAQLALEVSTAVADSRAPDPLALWWGRPDTWAPLTRPDSEGLTFALAGCLKVRAPWESVASEPYGFVPRIPADLGDPILLKGRGCAPNAPAIDWPPELLGKVMAHELGHALGLYHSVEASGQVDHLDDTGADNLMNFDPLTAGAEGLSPRQVRVLRFHPAIQWDAP
jgi:hypothetical protein